MLKQVKSGPAIEKSIPEGPEALIKTILFGLTVYILRASDSENARASFLFWN